LSSNIEQHVTSQPSDTSLREAFAQVELLLALEPRERGRALDALAESRPALRPLVDTLLKAAEDATRGAFLNEAAVLHGPSTDTSALKAGDHLGNYAVEALIGQGGMGEVWRARRTDGAYEAPIALKVLHMHLAMGSLRERFVREGRILGALSHANIARLLDAGVSTRNDLYLVLELVNGEPIDAWCDTRDLTLAERIRLFMQVCDAVAYAHAHMVVHRDLKPPNILVTQDGEVKLLDFGIAKLVAGDAPGEDAGDMTRLGERALTPDYAAPEQLRGEIISAATDVYALGVLLYQLLSGNKPYSSRDRSIVQLERDITQRPLVPPSDNAVLDSASLHGRAAHPGELRKSLRGDLDAIVARSLRLEPADRYADARALRDDLSRYLDHQPVQARAGARAYVWRLYLRRHWKPILAVSSVLLVLLIGTAAVAWQAHLARIEAAKALAVKGFLLDIFEKNSVLNPDVEKARSTTAQQLLDVGSKQILTGLRDQPEVRDELLATMGELYDQLELFDQSITLTRTRLDGLERRGIGPSPELADAQVNLGRALYSNGDYAAAEPVLRQSLRTLDQIKEWRSARRAHAMLELARVDNMTRAIDYPETVDLLKRSIAMYEQCCADDGDLPASIQTLARVSERRGDYAAAEQGYRRAVALLSAPPFLGSTTKNNAPGDIGRAYLDLGTFFLNRRRYADAEKNLRPAADVFAKTEGADSMDAISTQVRLGQTFVALNQPARGEAMVIDAQQSLQRIGGTDDVSLVTARSIAAAIELQRGELAAAGRNLERNRETFAHLHQTDAATCSARCTESASLDARLLATEGEYVTAEAALALSNAALRRLHSEKGFTFARNEILTAELAASRGQRDPALSKLNAIAVAFPPAPTELSEPYVLATLATVSVALPADPGAALSAADDLLARILALPDHDYFADWEARAQRAVGVALMANCKPREGEPHLRRAVALREMIDTPDSPWLAESRIDLAAALLKTGKTSEIPGLLALAAKAQANSPTLADHYREPLRALQAQFAQHPGTTLGAGCHAAP
jgi:serine/threonine-protein kinase